MLSIVPENQHLTMSSREIAELTQKQHSHVKRDIERMCVELNHPNLESSSYEHRGNTYYQYHLDKDFTTCLISGYNANIRMAIIKRWRELEEGLTPKWIAELSPEAQIAISDLAKQRDEAVKTKAQINDKRTATLMNKASQDAKRIKKLESKLQDVGQYQSIIAAGLPQRTETEVNPKAQTWRVLKKISEDMNLPPKKVKDDRYGEVNTYHVSVIARYKEEYLF